MPLPGRGSLWDEPCQALPPGVHQVQPLHGRYPFQGHLGRRSEQAVVSDPVTIKQFTGVMCKQGQVARMSWLTDHSGRGRGDWTYTRPGAKFHQVPNVPEIDPMMLAMMQRSGEEPQNFGLRSQLYKTFLNSLQRECIARNLCRDMNQADGYTTNMIKDIPDAQNLYFNSQEDHFSNHVYMYPIYTDGEFAAVCYHVMNQMISDIRRKIHRD